MKPSRKVDTEPPKEAVIQWLYYTGGEGMSMVTVGMLADGWLHGIYIRQCGNQFKKYMNIYYYPAYGLTTSLWYSINISIVIIMLFHIQFYQPVH